MLKNQAFLFAICPVLISDPKLIVVSSENPLYKRENKQQ